MKIRCHQSVNHSAHNSIVRAAAEHSSSGPRSDKMKDSLENVTLNSSGPQCVCGQGFVFYLSLVDIVTFLTGQPVVVTLLWTSLTSRKTPDILNCNLALFHNSQHLVSLVHLCILFLLPDGQSRVLDFLLAYAQTGGPMNLGFICIQRYVAVIHPTSYPLLKKRRYREVCVAMVWLFSLSFAIMHTFESFPAVAGKFFANLPFFLIMFMTSMVVHSSIKTVNMLKKPGPESDKLHPAKRRAFNAVRATFTITMCFYFPVALMQRVPFDNECDFDCVIKPVSFLLLSAASVAYPLFNLSTQRKFFVCCECEGLYEMSHRHISPLKNIFHQENK
ncbi:uncharacterized protein [Paralichthys olivaceus]|uniref:uncharacterized protein n=1 Tax=Paralichthys olivaceus TaxID=8255 RepID=UPI0037519CC8